MMTILPLVMFAVSLLFLRACLITLGFYKEPILSAFQQYGDEVGFSPLFDSCVWGLVLAYLLFHLACTFIAIGAARHIRFRLLFHALLAGAGQYPGASRDFLALSRLVPRNR